MKKVRIVIGYVDDDHPYPGVEVDWVSEPEFAFGTEVAALMTLEDLGAQLEAARKQVRHVMSWMSAAVIAARNNGEGKTNKEAIINHSGLARQTVHTLLKGK